MASSLTKSKLIARVARQVVTDKLSSKDVELAVKALIDYIADTLVDGGRVEVRGFGSFSLHFRAPRPGRNPRTGARMTLEGKYVPHFKSGKDLRERVNDSMFEDNDDDRDGSRGEAAHG